MIILFLGKFHVLEAMVGATAFLSQTALSQILNMLYIPALEQPM